MGKRTLKGAWIAFSLLPVDIFRYFGQILDILGKLPFLGKAGVAQKIGTCLSHATDEMACGNGE